MSQTLGRRCAGSARRSALAIAALASAVGLLVALSGAGAGVDRALQVWRDELHSRPASGRLALVEIDAGSLAALDHWPWPRHLHAQAIQALRRAGAQTIAFDVDFSAHSDPTEDAALARAIDRSDVPVILATLRQARSQGGGDTVDNLPLPAFRRHAQLAAVNIFADGDGLVRSYPEGVVTAGVPRPSMGPLLAGSPGRAGASFRIDGAIDPATIPAVSFVDLIRGRVPAGVLRGRSVLIGATAIELGDRYPVPGRGVIPGPLIQLLAAETLIQGSSPVDRGGVVPLLLVLLVLVFASRAGGRMQAAILGATAPALLLLPLATELAKLGSFDLAPALGALLAAAAALAVSAALRSLNEARLFDHETRLPNSRSLVADPATGDGGALCVLRIADYGAVVGVLGQRHAAEFVIRVAERLALASEGRIYRVENSALAWVIAPDDADEQVQRVDAAAALLRLPFEVGGRQVELTGGFGLAAAETDGGNAIGRATIAADRAIGQGLRWVRHSADLERESDWRLGLASELDRAMAAGDIWVAYQPKLELASGRIKGTEALVRWRHPTRGAIPPDAFIPALEESGRIADLTLYVLDRALTDQRGWATDGLQLGVAVNVSALLPANPDFVRRLEELLDRHAGAVDGLTLEVTESATMTDPDAAIAALERLASLGITLSIDDYGTGQSTLSYLKRLPAREIKIDKGFVLALESSGSDQAMVRSTIGLGHELGYRVVAEGVETEAALRMLRAYGCDIAQGWHIGRPVDAPGLAALARERMQEAA